MTTKSNVSKFYKLIIAVWKCRFLVAFLDYYLNLDQYLEMLILIPLSFGTNMNWIAALVDS